MIIEDYVGFKTASLLKKKGFDEDCRKWYFGAEHIDCDGNKVPKDKLLDSCTPYVNNKYTDTACTAPTIQQAIKWVRKKGFHIVPYLDIDYDEDERGTKWYHQATYYPEVIRICDGECMCDDGRLYATPEQACEAGIIFFLENLI